MNLRVLWDRKRGGDPMFMAWWIFTVCFVLGAILFFLTR